MLLVIFLALLLIKLVRVFVGFDSVDMPMHMINADMAFRYPYEYIQKMPAWFLTDWVTGATSTIFGRHYMVFTLFGTILFIFAILAPMLYFRMEIPSSRFVALFVILGIFSVNINAERIYYMLPMLFGIVYIISVDYLLRSSKITIAIAAGLLLFITFILKVTAVSIGLIPAIVFIFANERQRKHIAIHFLIALICFAGYILALWLSSSMNGVLSSLFTKMDNENSNFSLLFERMYQPFFDLFRGGTGLSMLVLLFLVLPICSYLKRSSDIVADPLYLFAGISILYWLPQNNNHLAIYIPLVFWVFTHLWRNRKRITPRNCLLYATIIFFPFCLMLGSAAGLHKMTWGLMAVIPLVAALRQDSKTIIMQPAHGNHFFLYWASTFCACALAFMAALHLQFITRPWEAEDDRSLTKTHLPMLKGVSMTESQKDQIYALLSIKSIVGDADIYAYPNCPIAYLVLEKEPVNLLSWDSYMGREVTTEIMRNMISNRVPFIIRNKFLAYLPGTTTDGIYADNLLESSEMYEIVTDNHYFTLWRLKEFPMHGETPKRPNDI